MKIFNKLKYRYKQTMLWLGVLNSPFKPFKLKLYMGKVAVGVPYFLPRKWVKFTEKDIQDAIARHKANKNYVQNLDDKLYEMYKGYQKPVTLKFGFNSCGLGWKTKWDSQDIRFEWSPVFSFVFFGYQIAITVIHEHPDHYWPAWLFYHLHTYKILSKEERLISCMYHFPLIYKSWTKDPVTGNTTKETRINYYKHIVKKKYLHLIQETDNGE